MTGLVHLKAVTAVALAFWGHAPHCGQPIVAWHDLTAAQGSDGPAVVVEGRAFPQACVVWLDARRLLAQRQTPAQQCALMVHEVGHLDGRAHSPDPRSVMYPVPAVPRVCLRFRANRLDNPAPAR